MGMLQHTDNSASLGPSGLLICDRSFTLGCGNIKYVQHVRPSPLRPVPLKRVGESEMGKAS